MSVGIVLSFPRRLLRMLSPINIPDVRFDPVLGWSSDGAVATPSDGCHLTFSGAVCRWRALETGVFTSVSVACACIYVSELLCEWCMRFSTSERSVGALGLFGSTLRWERTEPAPPVTQPLPSVPPPRPSSAFSQPSGPRSSNSSSGPPPPH